MGYLLSTSQKNGSSSRDAKIGTSNNDDFKPIDIGFNFGAGVNLNKFIFHLNSCLGLSNLIPGDFSRSVSIKNTNLSLGVGYFF